MNATLELRLDKKLSQKEVADYLHIEELHYAEYEIGSRRIEMENLIPLSNFYDVPLDYMMGLTNNIERNYIVAFSNLCALESISISTDEKSS